MHRHTSFLDFPGHLRSWQKLLPDAVLSAVTLALYLPSLYYGFVWDDAYYVNLNYRIQGLSLGHQSVVWTQEYLGHFAPIQHTLLAILYSMFGLEPFGYHLAQILLHTACLLLLFRVLEEMESARVAFVACLLFAVYPPNIETVAWISETKSTLAFLFFLISLWFFLRLRQTGKWGPGFLCGLFLILSLLSKINTVVAPAIFLLWDYRQKTLLRKDRLLSLAGFFALCVLFVVVHLNSFYASGQVIEGSTYYGGLAVHVMNVPLFVFFYIQKVLFPLPMSAWHMFVVYPEWNWTLATSWLGMLALLALLYFRGSRATQFWGAWFLVFLAPVLQLFPFGIWVADRYLYIPVVGAFVLLGKGFFWIMDRLPARSYQAAPQLALGAILVFFAWHTNQHLPVWRNNLTLWGATLPTCDTSAYCHTSMGSALLASGQIEPAVRELIRAVELRPAPQYLIRLGDVYAMALKDYRQAFIAYSMARTQGGPSINAAFYAKLARLHILTGDLDAAEQAIQAGMQDDSHDPSLLVSRTFLERKKGNLAEARRFFQSALAITGQASRAAGFLSEYWGDPTDVRSLLSDLRPDQSPVPQ